MPEEKKLEDYVGKNCAVCLEDGIDEKVQTFPIECKNGEMLLCRKHYIVLLKINQLEMLRAKLFNGDINFFNG